MPKVDLADKLGDARSRVIAEQTEPEFRALPKFARLTRKETRVREDQYAALSALTRTLMRRRTVKSERITENTLIRVAIDLLLLLQQHLAGGTEAELRNSVTRVLAELQSSDLRESATSRDQDSGRPGPADSESSGRAKSDRSGLADTGSPAAPQYAASGFRGFRTSAPDNSATTAVSDPRTNAHREGVIS